MSMYIYEFSKIYQGNYKYRTSSNFLKFESKKAKLLSISIQTTLYEWTYIFLSKQKVVSKFLDCGNSKSWQSLLDYSVSTFRISNIMAYLLVINFQTRIPA